MVQTAKRRFGVVWLCTGFAQKQDVALWGRRTSVEDLKGQSGCCGMVESTSGNVARTVCTHKCDVLIYSI